MTKNKNAVQLGKLSAESRRKKLGEKHFIISMREIRKKGVQKLFTPPIANDERS